MFRIFLFSVIFHMVKHDDLHRTCEHSEHFQVCYDHGNWVQWNSLLQSQYFKKALEYYETPDAIGITCL